MSRYKNIHIGKDNEYFNLYKNLYLKTNEQMTTFDEDKPITLPEFGLSEGLLKDTIENLTKKK